MKTLLGAVVLAFIIGLAVPAFALFGLPETVEGTVEEISDDTLALYAVKGNAEEILQIRLDDETEYQDVPETEALQPGDMVLIKFKEKDGQRIAVSVKRIAAGVELEI